MRSGWLLLEEMPREGVRHRQLIQRRLECSLQFSQAQQLERPFTTVFGCGELTIISLMSTTVKWQTTLAQIFVHRWAAVVNFRDSRLLPPLVPRPSASQCTMKETRCPPNEASKPSSLRLSSWGTDLKIFGVTGQYELLGPWPENGNSYTRHVSFFRRYYGYGSFIEIFLNVSCFSCRNLSWSATDIYYLLSGTVLSCSKAGANFCRNSGIMTSLGKLIPAAGRSNVWRLVVQFKDNK